MSLETSLEHLPISTDPENWSCRVHNPANGKSVYIVDTGGTFLIVRNLELYTACGRSIVDEVSSHMDAADIAEGLVV